MKKNVLVFDWSNMCFRSLFTTQVFGNARSYDTQEEVDSFIAKMGTDLAMIIRTFVPDNVIFAIDSPDPWRKDLLKDQEVGYKGQREKSKDLNWDNIYKGLDEFKKILEGKGFKFAYTSRAEADDMMALVKEAVFATDDKNIIIVSSDADIRQLADFDSGKEQYCAVFNPIGSGKGGKKKLYMTHDCIEWFNTKDQVDIFFSNINQDKEYIKNSLNRDKKIEMSEIDSDQVLLEKVFCGDVGDNVPCFYEFYHNGKKKRITEKKCQNICESLCVTDMTDLVSKSILLKETIEKAMKTTIDDIDVIDRLDRQRRLVELNSELFPKSIKNYLADLVLMVESPMTLDHISVSKVKIHDMLAGTRLFSTLEKKKAKNADIFKSIDKYAEELKSISLL